MRVSRPRAWQLSLLEEPEAEEDAGAPAIEDPPRRRRQPKVETLDITPGRIEASVVGRDGEGMFRVSLTMEPRPRGIGYVACAVLLRNVPWWKSLADGWDVDVDGFARELTRHVPGECRDMGRLHIECSCGTTGGGCEHTGLARRQAAGELEASHRARLRFHGFDLDGWLRSVDVQEAGLEERSLHESWRPQPPRMRPEPLPEMPDLAPVPFLRDEIIGRMRFSPYGKGFAGRMRKWMELVAERGASLGEGRDSGRDHPLKSRELCVKIGRNCRLESMFADSGEERDPDDPGPPAPEEAELVSMLASVDPGKAGELGETNRYWVRLFRYAVRLAQQGALVPERVLGFDRGVPRILWRPATGLSEQLREVHGRFASSCPRGLVEVGGDPSLLALALRGGAETQLRQAVDLLLRGIVGLAQEEASGHGQGPGRKPDRSGAAFGWNFIDETPATRVTTGWMRRWFRRLALPPKRPGMTMLVAPREKRPDDISLTIGFLDEDRKEAPPRKILDRRPSPAFLENVSDLLGIFHEPLADFLDTPSDSFDLDLLDYPQLESDAINVIPVTDTQVDLSDMLAEAEDARVSFRMTPKGRPATGTFDMRSLMGFDWAVAMGDRKVGAAEFGKLVRRARKMVDRRMRQGEEVPPVVIVRGKEGFVRLGRDLLGRAEEELGKGGLSHFELLRAALTGEHAGIPVDLDREAKCLLEETLSPRDPPVPPGGLGKVLRPYQRTGFEWLAQNADIGFGSILADDMGLGKTLQAIALAAHRTARDPSHKTLVVAPTALLTNWLREIRRFAPRLRAHIYHGAGRRLDTASCDVVLTSYGIAKRDTEKLGATGWGLMVADEAQNIKNPATKLSQVIKGYRASALVAMTGTPVENHLGDYWSIFDFTNRGYLGSSRGFRAEIAVPIERDRDEGTLRRFRKMTGPFILRRLKTDKSVIRDLPEKIEGRQFCALAPAQAALYKATVDKLMGDVAGSGSADGGRNMRRRGLILKLLTALKQVCDSPALYLRKGKALPSESGKLALCLEILRELADTGEKALVFTQYVEMGRLLVDAVQADLGSQPLFLHGGLGRKARDQIVDRFQQDPEARNMVLSLKAGGTGLNLTAATQVIHFDRWWNPAVEAQATDRAFRIGQTRRVQVHVLVTENTLEERIDEMLAAKRELSELTVRSGEKWLTEMDDRQLRELVELTRPLE